VLDYCGLDYIFDGWDSSGKVMYGISQRTNRSRPVESGTCEHAFTMTKYQWDRVMDGGHQALGFIAPAILIHSYVSDGKSKITVDAVGIIRLLDLLTYAQDHLPEPSEHQGGTYYRWTFHDLDKAGVHIDRFPSPVLCRPYGHRTRS